MGALPQLVAAGAVVEPSALTSDTLNWRIALGDVGAGEVGTGAGADVDDQVREVADRRAAEGRHDRAAGVAGRAEARPAVAVVVEVRGQAELGLALRDGDVVAVAVVRDGRRVAARIGALRAADDGDRWIDAPLGRDGGSILISDQSLPGTPSPEVIFATVPTTPIVVVSSCIVTSCPTRSVQRRRGADVLRRAVREDEVRRAAVRRDDAARGGDAGVCTPGHSVLSASAATVAVPFEASCVLTAASGTGRRPDSSPADAVPAREMARAHAHASTAVGLKRIRLLPRTNVKWNGAHSRSAPQLS